MGLTPRDSSHMGWCSGKLHAGAPHASTGKHMARKRAWQTSNMPS